MLHMHVNRVRETRRGRSGQDWGERGGKCYVIKPDDQAGGGSCTV